MRLFRVRRGRGFALALVVVLFAPGPSSALGTRAGGTERAEAIVESEAPAPPVASGVPDPLLNDEDYLDDAVGASDPWEGMNRGIFSFNREVDRYVLDPVTSAYRFVVPAAGRRAVHRAVQNLDSPIVFANQVLQLRLKAAGITLSRFLINSTAGVGGLFDAAAEGADIARVDADFGQTLACYGTPSGPYLMLPLLGPSTVRDAFGGAVDALGDPVTYVLGPFQWWTLLLGTGEGLVVREAHQADLNALEEGSIDFYSALRSAYLQNREATVREAAEVRQPSLVAGRP